MKQDKMFYIGRGSYNISGNHELEDPTVSKTVRTAQITALSNRFDERKINTFNTLLGIERVVEMTQVYDSVMDPKSAATPNGRPGGIAVRSHGTMKALLIHLFCNIPPKGCQNNKHCEYFHAGTHFQGATTMHDILCLITPYHDIHDYQNSYAKRCENKIAGTINGGYNNKTNNNRGIIYYVGYKWDSRTFGTAFGIFHD